MILRWTTSTLICAPQMEGSTWSAPLSCMFKLFPALQQVFQVLQKTIIHPFVQIRCFEAEKHQKHAGYWSLKDQDYCPRTCWNTSGPKASSTSPQTARTFKRTLLYQLSSTAVGISAPWINRLEWCGVQQDDDSKRTAELVSDWINQADIKPEPDQYFTFKSQSVQKTHLYEWTNNSATNILNKWDFFK